MAVTNNVLQWGKCKVIIDKLETSSKKEIDQIQEGTTQLTTEQGDKTEALLEGGEVLATRYQRNKYTLEFTEYGEASITNDDGIVSGTHTATIICADTGTDVEVCTFPKAVINVQSEFSSEYGTLTKYTINAQRDTTLKKSIVWGTYSES